MMESKLEKYASITGWDVVEHIYQLAKYLKGLYVIHINSTRKGGGVAEILQKLVPLMKELDINVEWEVITGDEVFFQITKSFHNALHGASVHIAPSLLEVYEEVARKNAEILRQKLESADVVFIHDPQPAPLIKYISNRKGRWIWRCHIDISRPFRPVWKYLRNFLIDYDASVFHTPDFAQRLPHPQYIIPPSIDPLSEKNITLTQDEINEVLKNFSIDIERPMILQVSRFDRLKDPVGVIEAYKLAKSYYPSLQLVLAGGGATDDPEGEAVLKEVQVRAGEDKDIHILYLPPDSHKIINALQRGANIVLQKSLKEGFGLTVTEAMWKGKPVIGGNTGGIRLQVFNGHTGFLVSTPEGAALRIRYLLSNPNKCEEMGQKAYRLVKENFLITRHLRDYLALMMGLVHGFKDRIELG